MIPYAYISEIKTLKKHFFYDFNIDFLFNTHYHGMEGGGGGTRRQGLGLTLILEEYRRCIDVSLNI